MSQETPSLFISCLHWCTATAAESSELQPIRTFPCESRPARHITADACYLISRGARAQAESGHGGYSQEVSNISTTFNAVLGSVETSAKEKSLFLSDGARHSINYTWIKTYYLLLIQIRQQVVLEMCLYKYIIAVVRKNCVPEIATL